MPAPMTTKACERGGFGIKRGVVDDRTSLCESVMTETRRATGMKKTWSFVKWESSFRQQSQEVYMFAKCHTVDAFCVWLGRVASGANCESTLNHSPLPSSSTNDPWNSPSKAGTVVNSKSAVIFVVLRLVEDCSIIVSETIRHTRQAIMLVKARYDVVSM